jgi:stage V sporulation protein G
MEITDISIYRVINNKNLKAYVDVVFDDCFIVHNVRIIKGKSGLHIAMPNLKTGTGRYIDIVHPINVKFRGEIQDVILDNYASRVVEDTSTIEQYKKKWGL